MSTQLPAVQIDAALLRRIQRHLVGPEPEPLSPDADDYFATVAEVDSLLAEIAAREAE